MNVESTTTIRRAGISDATRVAALAAATFCETFGHLYQPEDLQAFLSSARSEERYRRLITDVRMGLWLAFTESDEPIGYAVAGPCKLPVEALETTAGEVQELYLRADYHGHQIGTRLLTAALDWLAAERFAPLYVGVWSENPGAQRLYERFGFHKIGEYGFPVGNHIDREFILER